MRFYFSFMACQNYFRPFEAYTCDRQKPTRGRSYQRITEFFALKNMEDQAFLSHIFIY